MMNSRNWKLLILPMALTCIPVSAQQYISVQYVDQAKTPVESVLSSPELSMTGLGLGSSQTQLGKRFDYAQEHKWLSDEQLTVLRNELKGIADKIASSRDSAGKLPFEARQSLGKQITELNEKYEEQVLVREQSMPGIEGLIARQAMTMQRITKAITLAKIAPKRGGALKAELKAAMTDLPEGEISEEKTKEISQTILSVNQKLDKELEASASHVAGRGSFSIRQYEQSNATY